jgi:hypothetical protein
VQQQLQQPVVQHLQPRLRNTAPGIRSGHAGQRLRVAPPALQVERNAMAPRRDEVCFFEQVERRIGEWPHGSARCSR